MKGKLATFQKWLPFKQILDNGVIQLKDNTYVKLIRVFPINYNLKSELEKKVILNSFKNFFRTCEFDIQVLVQSTKEDLSQHVSIYEEEQKKEENEVLNCIYEKYINFIQDKNSKREYSTKNFIIIIREFPKSVVEDIENNNLNDKYYKIRESLSKCGNLVTEFSKEDVIQYLYSCFNYNNFN